MDEKQKIEGVDNKELILFGVIIAILAILLIFEFFFFKGRPEVAEESAKVQEQLEEMQATTVEVEQKTVYKALNNIVAMMNSKDYKGLYAMLKDDYKSYYFREYEDFEDFIKVYAGQEYYAKYNSYYRDDKYYYIIVDFLQPKYTRDDLLKQRATKVDTIVLEEVAKNEFKFATNGFIENIIHDSSKTVDGVTFSLISSLRNTETIKTLVSIENNSEKSILVSTSNIQPDVSGGMSAKISTTGLETISPGESVIMSIEYYFQYNSGKEFNGVRITGVTGPNGNVLKDIYLAK